MIRSFDKAFVNACCLSRRHFDVIGDTKLSSCNGNGLVSLHFPLWTILTLWPRHLANCKRHRLLYVLPSLPQTGLAPGSSIWHIILDLHVLPPTSWTPLRTQSIWRITKVGPATSLVCVAITELLLSGGISWVLSQRSATVLPTALLKEDWRTLAISRSKSPLLDIVLPPRNGQTTWVIVSVVMSVTNDLPMNCPQHHR